MRRFPLLALLVPFAVGCTASSGDDDADSTESNIEVQARNLWAGMTSVTIERSPSDPCNNGRNALDNEPAVYESWARQRADVRNVCFEVWKPGITDNDGADFAKALDVQVHYRYKGESAFKTAYVPSIDRRGNNRRYAWNLSQDLDGLPGENVADSKGQIEVVKDFGTSAYMRSELQFYFTVNGKKLSTSTNNNFRIAYQSTIRKQAPISLPGPAVLHPKVTCNGLTAGGGAGFDALDITDQSAINAILNDDYFHAATLAMSGSGASRTLTVRFSETLASPPGTLPHYHDGSFNGSVRAETEDAGSGKFALRVKVYDRTTKKLKTISRTFSSCVMK